MERSVCVCNTAESRETVTHLEVRDDAGKESEG
jgi:hypothetical protein